MIGNRLREARRQKGMTQEELANKAGISRYWLNSIENGRQPPGRATMIRLSEVLDISVGDLFFAPGGKSDCPQGGVQGVTA